MERSGYIGKSSVNCMVRKHLLLIYRAGVQEQNKLIIINTFVWRTGPISSLTAFGQHLIIVNEAHIAVELLEKRSAIYSDRPTLVFGGEMYGVFLFIFF